ncbi:MAG: biotin--[acetyl-CoA-carboxylase] ligase [Candidatus Omnitrophica bacterium]|nr:biotin--[acetyl-CoA-carboxylase] ligase [Candidatus Omnitrophota bacterium]
MNELVLKALREENHVSGEDLGKRLKISRTAVWKHIKELRKKGYKIKSSPKLGYSFIESTSLLLPEEITPGLQTQTIGKHLLHHDEITSTQDIAEELAREGAKEGTVVIAETQTRGRGRKGRSWVSPPEGGVYLSIILRPNLMPSRIVQIPLIAGVAVSRAVSRVTPLHPRLKWPNDIIINGKKAGGILTEMNSEVDGVNYVILGIGINVNTPGHILAGPTQGIATSLADECGEQVSRVRLVQHLFSEFEALYAKFLISGFDSLREEWKTLNNTIGSRVRISDEEEIEGKAIDIDDEGFLLVRKENGNVRRIIGGDVTLLGI